MLVEPGSLCWVAGRMVEARNGETWAVEFARFSSLGVRLPVSGSDFVFGFSSPSRNQEQNLTLLALLASDPLGLGKIAIPLGPNDEMPVVGHQTVSPLPHPASSQRFLNDQLERQKVLVFGEKHCPAHTSVEHVENHPPRRMSPRS